jgi:hypothetical protein
MVLGTIIVGSATTIVSAGIAVILVAGVLGLGIGCVFGAYMKKKYKDEVVDFSPLQKAATRAQIMIKLFPDIRDQFDKDTQLYLLENIIYEGEKILSLSDKMNSDFVE